MTTLAGIFYIGQDLLNYYDYEAEGQFVLCSQPNCKHEDDKCPAWVGDNFLTTGLAFYQGKIHYLRQMPQSTKVELVAMDVSGSQQLVIASFNTQVDDWTLVDISEVYYCADHVFLKLSWPSIRR